MRANPRLVRRLPIAMMLVAVSWATLCNRSRGQALPADRQLPMNPTLGGKLFWSDHLVLHDWRIQQHVLTGHFRLLDDRDFRRAGGTLERCRRELDKLRRELALPALGTRCVIVLHGLGRSRQSMAGMVKYLRNNSDFTVLNVSYASTRTSIATHAANLAEVVRQLPSLSEQGRLEEVSFVAHSMGNLVIRHFIADALRQEADDRQRLLSPLKRVVMLAPPNQGAMLAERFEANPFFRLLWGASGREVADWETLAPQLAVPPCQFGILAAGMGNAKGRNPLIRGDDDFVVAVAETKLPGARDFLVVPTLHAVIMDFPAAQQATLRFLQQGHFLSADQRQPIAHEESP